MSTCSSCRAPITWVKTTTGKTMPLDAEPADDGNIVVENGIAAYLKKGQGSLLPVPRYKSHFATCPQSAEHRRSR